MAKSIKKAQIGKEVPKAFKKVDSSESQKKYSKTPAKSQKSSDTKKPSKYYSEYDAGRGKFDKPRTEKQQKQWEKDEQSMIDYPGRPKMKSGGTLSPSKKSVGKTIGKLNKAKSGTSLGMKSVKAGFDKNPGVTRADIIVAGKGQAKKGTKISAKKMMGGGKCKYGCK